MKLVAFTVPDEIADELSRGSVYLDVFGHVRWTGTGEVVAGSSRWTRLPVSADAQTAEAVRTRVLDELLETIREIDEPGSDAAVLTRRAQSLAHTLADSRALVAIVQEPDRA